MALIIRNSSLILKNQSFKSVESEPPFGFIFRVANTGASSDSLTYTNISGSSVSTGTIAPGGIVYVLALSGSLSDATSVGAGGQLTTMNLLIKSFGESAISFTEQLITTTGAGTWTKPLGVTQVIVECWGGGGAGGGCAASLDIGVAAGGAGGQYVRSLMKYTSPSITIPYIVAASTTGTVNSGADGGDTSWNRVDVYAKGGQGGQKAVNITFPAYSETSTGGTGTTLGGFGNVVRPGGSGGNGYYLSFAAIANCGGGGSGAGSVQDGTTSGIDVIEFGGSGSIGYGSLITTVNGSPGKNYGGGGSGAAGGSTVSATGGTGAQGLIRLIYR